jgi:hypothetical protein
VWPRESRLLARIVSRFPACGRDVSVATNARHRREVLEGRTPLAALASHQSSHVDQRACRREFVVCRERGKTRSEVHRGPHRRDEKVKHPGHCDEDSLMPDQNDFLNEGRQIEIRPTTWAPLDPRPPVYALGARVAREESLRARPILSGRPKTHLGLDLDSLVV